ncbi:recombinase family protein [Actinoallomurus sp. CA-150999]|uniref:recombinase family protein n=1 Tax=Actinoallomurus sp. CA-150999 TaxID=3239887 RepID=UPI003D8FF448
MASDDPGTKMMVSVLAAVLEFQRDMISENTHEGIAAAEASGKTLGRPAALGPGKAADVVTAYQEGTAVKALAREYWVAPKTIRRILDAAHARQLADQLDAPPVPDEQPAPATQTSVKLDLPGLLADHLHTAGDDTIRQALATGRTIRCGQGHTIRLTAPLELHHAALQQSARPRRRAGRTQGLPGVRHPHPGRPAVEPCTQRDHRSHTTTHGYFGAHRMDPGRLAWPLRSSSRLLEDLSVGGRNPDPAGFDQVTPAV